MTAVIRDEPEGWAGRRAHMCPLSVPAGAWPDPQPGYAAPVT